MTSILDIAFSKMISTLIGKLLDGLGKRGKERRALAKAISVSLARLKHQDPKNHKILFGSKKFWEVFKDEFENLLDPNKQPNIERLANKIEPFASIPRKELLDILAQLFDLLREEMAKKPDLMIKEQYRAISRVEGKLNTICDELGIDQSIDSLDGKAYTAARKALSQHFQLHQRPKHQMELNFYAKEDDAYVNLEDVCQFLEFGYKLLMQAEPGGGKSTTLYQLSEKLLNDNEGPYPIFISLPLWYAEKTFLEYVAGQDAFSEQHLNENNLKSLARHGHLVLILDGWNELPQQKLAQARTKLLNFQKDYPDVAILIASRQSTLPPELRMASRLSLQRLTPEQRNHYIKNSLGLDLARRLINELDGKKTLEDFTFIPFYLDMLVKMFLENQALPETKEELLQSFVNVHNGKTEIREKLQNYQQDYLTALSVAMLREGTTALDTPKATQVIHAEIESLKAKGKLQAAIEPLDILDALASHHLLVFTGEAWQTQHHQFQEWYASHHVEKVISDALVNSEQSRLKELRETILNIPRWEESLFFAIERMLKTNNNAQLSVLILQALEIDPLLAAEIIYRVNEDIWLDVRETVQSYVENWHQPGHVDRALTFMVASGRPEFSDLIWPLLTHQDHQIRLQAVRAFEPFRTNCLGYKWLQELQRHPERIRQDFLSEIAHSRGDQPQFLLPRKSRGFGSYHSPQGIPGIRRIPANGEFQGCCVA